LKIEKQRKLKNEQMILKKVKWTNWKNW